MTQQEPGSPQKNVVPRWDDTSSSTRHRRGGCLTLWLSISIILSIFTLVGIVAVFNEASRSSIALRSGAQTSVILLGLLIVGGLICLFGILSWKRWGVYGVPLTSFLSLLVQLIFFRTTLRDWVVPFLQAVLLYWLVKDKWEDFE